MGEVKNIVHLCDCMEFMRDLPDNHYDLAIVDPPYGIGEDGGDKKRNRGYRKIVNHEKKHWDALVPPGTFFEALQRITKDRLIFGANYFPQHLTSSMGWIVWDKQIGGDFSDGELIYTSFKRALRIKSISYHHGLRGGHDRIHPTQKPVALYKWLLSNYAKPGDTIFDSHVGSGSIRIACHDLDFEFTGCEIDADYHAAQEARYQKHCDQLRLF